MNKKKRQQREDCDDCDDNDSNDDTPDMSYRPRQQMRVPPPQQSSASTAVPDPNANGASSSSSAHMSAPPQQCGAPPDGASSSSPHSWQDVLVSLLKQVLPDIGRHGRQSCPFTREGLANMYRANPEGYRRLRELSGFDLCVDPTSPHTLLGGTAFCRKHDIKMRSHLVQHCGPQPGGKTAAIGHRPPARGDDAAWRKFPAAEQLHLVLLQELTGQKEMSAVQRRERVPSEQPTRKIVWPPMVRVCGLTEDEGASSAKLSEKFYKFSSTHQFPVYDFEGFRGEAVLLFSTAEDDNYMAFDRARSLIDECPNASLVEWAKFEEWRHRKWAIKLLQKAGKVEPRLEAAEKAKQHDRVKQIAQVAEEERRRNVILAADKDREAQLRREQEDVSKELQAQQDELEKQMAAERLEAQRLIGSLEVTLKDTRAQLQQEQNRQARAQQELMEAFGSELSGICTQNLQLSEAQKVAEMKVRNTQYELTQFKSMMAQKESQMRELLNEQRAEFERQKAEAAARAQTVAQAEEARRYEERRAQMLKDLQDQLEHERRGYEAKLEEKEKEVLQAKEEEETAGFGKSEYNALVGQNQSFNQGQRVLEEALIEGFADRLTEGRFQIFKPGQLSLTLLRKCGIKLPTKNTSTEAEEAAFLEVQNWQAVLYNAVHEVSQDIKPLLNVDHAFVRVNGIYAHIREHDEPEKEQKP